MHTSKRTLLLMGNRLYYVKPMTPKESYFASLNSKLHNTSISNSVSTHKKLLKVGLQVCGARKLPKKKNYVMKCQINTTHKSSDRREINLTMH